MTWYVAFSEFPFSVQQSEPVHRHLCFYGVPFQIYISSEYTKEIYLSAFFSHHPIYYIRNVEKAIIKGRLNSRSCFAATHKA